ncbi:lipid II:glycine glycyltransferase FemX [Alkalicoccus saliphilus]|uniref:Lipid II:glycine glycyltransferase n=1 Tax=Alkalicoccus saliphilus TaxID=200989 RepID=A0A2T4UA06_9BACI|nr:GNAT family N-acetyltransferase [Alkalicoccus saliphilus]PTL40238.1 hypothetical protein C6Y45_02335 [Alkalicoccus saliphilus]
MLAHSERKVFHVVEDKKLWDMIITQFPQADVYYTHAYCNWTAEAEGGKAKLIFFKCDNGIIIYPVIIRNIRLGQKEEVYDITSPYGYGGPLLRGEPETLSEFKEALRHYCTKNNIISEVIRLHPLLNNAEYMTEYCPIQYVRQTTAVNLKPSLEDIRRNYSKMNKRNIKKAVKNNVVCREVQKTEENIESFYNLYKETMERKQASSYYFFGKESLKKQLIDTPISKSHLLFAYDGEEVISAVVLFTSNELAHYHLGASRKEYLYLRPNNLIFDYMTKVSKEAGCHLLHLGGGYQENDNLFMYKTSFTDNNNYNFYIGKRVYDETLYKEMEERAGSSAEETFFPSYRAPVREKV